MSFVYIPPGKIKYMLRIVFIVTALISIASCRGRFNEEVTKEELYNHISFLASDELAGRLTGTEGDSLAAEYIRKEFLTYGLEPLENDGFQRFGIISKLVATDLNEVEIDGNKLIRGTDFMPLSLTENGKLEAEVVVAGYGFNIESDTLNWNDYTGLDVKGKWVMVLRADPEIDKNASGFAPVSSDRYKAMTARDRGAAGIIFVSGEKYDPMDEFENLSGGDLTAGIPAIRIKRSAAQYILGSSGTSIEDIEKNLNESRKPAGFATGITVSATTDIERRRNPTRNVVMLLPGSDPILKNEYVIVGAHFDHLGMGGEGSSSRATDTIATHYGADDNASGVALMIELAGKFSATPGGNARSMIFVALSGEEMGLLGAKYFVENSPVDLKSVNAMINLDMVGRMKDEKVLQVGGAGTATGLREILSANNDSTKLTLVISDEGYGPSDHSAFYGKDIPVLFVSTGAHLDYHTPFDTKERINYDGMVTISDYLYKVAAIMVNSTERLAFTESGPKDGGSRGTRRKGVTLGLMPDFAGNITDGLRADFITPGKPAAIGGMLKGDIIKSINGKSVNNIEDYMFRLNQLKPGERITVEVLRGDRRELLLIQL
jgi:aminopeptidase YwaD